MRLALGHRRCVTGAARRAARLACALAVAALALLGPATPAFAESSQEVREQAAEENERLQELLGQIEQGHAQIDELDAQTKELADQSVTIQNALIEDRANLASMVSKSYRWGSPGIVDIALSSASLSDFISRLYYANKVVKWQSDCVDNLNRDKDKLEAQMDEIDAKRTERKKAVENLDAAADELSAKVAELTRQAEQLEEEERAAELKRLEEIARQAKLEEERKAKQREQAEAEEAARKQAAEDMQRAAEEAAAKEAAEQEAAEQEAAEQEAAEEAAEGDSQSAEEQDAAGDDQQTEENVADETTTEDGDASGEDDSSGEESAAGDWIECIASAYSIADNDPPGTTATASGIPLDESVPTVAMPMAISPSQFYGMQIQIEYQGMTVIATVTDCGDLAGGARGLDLTPAVFRAFGATSCDDWGLRTVRYRFLS